ELQMWIIYLLGVVHNRVSPLSTSPMAIPCASTSLQTCIDCFADRYGHRFLSQKSKCETSSPFSVSQQQCRISLVGCESEQRSTRTLVNNSRSQISQT